VKIFFASANCLIDPSSGAARSVATFLSYLSRSGHTCQTLTGSIYDKPLSENPIENMQMNGAVPVTSEQGELNMWRQDIGGVQHLIFPTLISKRGFVPARDELKIYRHALTYLDLKKPDVFMTYGNGLLERILLRDARDRGIATFFYLAHPGYKEKAVFKDVDQVFTDTEATRALYEERFSFGAYAIGKFIIKPRAPNPAQPRVYVTFINPAPEKGVTLFYRIAQISERELPDLKFLVVESRSSLEQADERLGTGFAKLSNIVRVGLQQDMGRVFGMTRILLMPSLWHESGGRAAIEALSLGIPVISTNRGGLPETLGKAPIMLDVNQDLIEDPKLIPDDAAARPWIESLTKLATDPEFYQDRQRLSLEQWDTHNPDLRMPAIIDRMHLVLSRTQREPVGIKG
jgi:glycosyltransferase involved in cell wall biosynthesis